MKFHTCSKFLIATLVLLCGVAHATSSLSFEGGGYWLDLEIGHTDRPVVASVKFHRPGDSKGVVLRGNFSVDSFDTDRKELTLIYKGGNPQVEPFTLSVRGDTATLRISGAEEIVSAFDWFM